MSGSSGSGGRSTASRRARRSTCSGRSARRSPTPPTTPAWCSPIAFDYGGRAELMSRRPRRHAPPANRSHRQSVERSSLPPRVAAGRRDGADERRTACVELPPLAERRVEDPLHRHGVARFRRRRPRRSDRARFDDRSRRSALVALDAVTAALAGRRRASRPTGDGRARRRRDRARAAPPRRRPAPAPARHSPTSCRRSRRASAPSSPPRPRRSRTSSPPRTSRSCAELAAIRASTSTGPCSRAAATTSVCSDCARRTIPPRPSSNSTTCRPSRKLRSRSSASGPRRSNTGDQAELDWNPGDAVVAVGQRRLRRVPGRRSRARWARNASPSRHAAGRRSPT